MIWIELDHNLAFFFASSALTKETELKQNIVPFWLLRLCLVELHMQATEGEASESFNGIYFIPAIILLTCFSCAPASITPQTFCLQRVDKNSPRTSSH